MKSLVISSILILLASTSFGSSTGSEAERPIGSISGTITDKQTDEPVAFATVALYKSNDTTNIIKGVVTNDNGEYIFSEVPIGKYDIKVSYVGYNPITIKEIKLDRSLNEIKLGNIEMYESVAAIAEVEIVQERLKGEEQIDKTVYTINDQVRNSSTSGLDMLKHIPAVSVDFQENVTLEGQSDILFYVDGIERNKDFVAQLDPKLIDKVEIITNPGVKYSADISGVINIVLVKEPRHGINGSVKMDVPHPTMLLINPRGNIEYGNQHFRTFIGSRAHVEKFDGSTTATKDLIDTENPYYFEKNGEGQNMWWNGMANYGFDWFINDNTSLNFYTEWRKYNGLERDYNFYESTYINDILSDYQVNKKSGVNGGGSMFYSLYFKKKFNDKGNELTLEANYYDYNGGHEADFSYTEYDPLNTSSILSVEDWTEKVNNNRNNTEFKADYTLVFDKVKQEIGYRGYYQWMNNEKTLTNEPEIEKFEYNEIRNTGYYSLTGSIKKFTLQGGVRYENSIFQIPEQNDIHFDILLPQFKFSYKLNEAQSIKLSYRKKVYRPNINDLNPFDVFIDSTMYRRGNPNMKPTIDNKAELSYSINFKSNFISPKAYFIYTNNGIAENSTVENGITIITQDNILDRYEYGLSLNGAVQLHKRWRLNFYAAGFNRIVGTDDSREEKISGRTHLTNIFMLPKDITVFAMLNYNSPNIRYQRIFYRDMLFIIGAEKKISKRAKVSLFYNPFIKEFTYSKVKTYYGNNYEYWAGSVNVNQLFAIEFTYNFNYGKKVKKINRSTDYEQDGGGGLM